MATRHGWRCSRKRGEADRKMSDQIYGQWFLTKDVPVPDNEDSHILVVIREGLNEDGYVVDGAFTFADAWLRIPPPPWMEGK
jgi:hypothetical protein